MRTALSWCTAVQFPVFVDTTLEVYRTTYAVRAFAVHLGASPTSGHYRALLYDDISGELHCCDDHVKPVLLHDFHTVSSDIYVVVLSRQQDSRDLQCILLFMIFRSTSRYAGYAWNSKRVDAIN